VILQRVQALEDPVVEELLAQFIPDVLNRIELGRVRRQFQQVDVGWRFERVAAMPASAVNHHDDLILWVSCRDLVQEQLHASGVDVRQDQTVQLASADVHRAISVGVFVRQHALADGAQRFGCPAPAYVRDASKARLVLKHQLDGFALCPVLADLDERFGEFFFHSS
jgi:hypothetical protein